MNPHISMQKLGEGLCRIGFIFIFLVLGVTELMAQKPMIIKGNVLDTVSHSPLVNASVSVLNLKDSILRRHTRTDVQGKFSVELPSGRYLLLVSAPGYVDFVEPFSLDIDDVGKDFKTIPLQTEAHLLEEVIVKGQAALIKLRGDTVEFNAGALVVQPNSRVEDLLKQISGIEVDRNGSITAYGETVQKVLLDGEEFFGDDPTLITRNIRAEMVDKMLLYDKTIEGIGGSNQKKTKTLDIRLKEDKSKGYFGKIDTKGGTDRFYQGQGMYNHFSSKSKAAAYLTLSNTSITGLNGDDTEKYSYLTNYAPLLDGGLNIVRLNDNLSASEYYGEGLPKSWGGGVHYDQKLGPDKYLNANYKTGRLSINGDIQYDIQNNLPGSQILSNQALHFNNSSISQKLYIGYRAKLNSTTTFRFTAHGLSTDGEVRQSFMDQASLGNVYQMYSGNRIVSNDVKNDVAILNALALKNFKKPGRNLSLNLTGAFNMERGTGFLRSITSFFDTQGSLDSIQTIDQKKNNSLNSSVVNVVMSYSEPVSKTLGISVNYGVAYSRGTLIRLSLNKGLLGDYMLPDQRFSNNYDFSQLSNQFGIFFNYRKNKITTTLGTNSLFANFRQNNNMSHIRYRRTFTIWQPQATLNYRIAAGKTLDLRATGLTVQPTFEQLQPVRSNLDPINVTSGNSALRPAFTSNYSIRYNTYKVAKGESFTFSGQLAITYQAIINNISTSISGLNEIGFTNLHSKTQTGYSMYLNRSKKLGKSGFSLNANLGASGHKSYAYSNDILGDIRSDNVALRMGISKYLEKKFEVNVGVGPSFIRTISSLQNMSNITGWGYSGRVYGSLFLPLGLKLSGDADYQYRPRTDAFSMPFNRMLINMSIAKRIGKDDPVSLSIVANDLLNQNSGFVQGGYNNYITQKQFDTIRRYFLLSLTWDFNKMGGGDRSED